MPPLHLQWAIEATFINERNSERFHLVFVTKETTSFASMHSAGLSYFLPNFNRGSIVEGQWGGKRKR